MVKLVIGRSNGNNTISLFRVLRFVHVKPLAVGMCGLRSHNLVMGGGILFCGLQHLLWISDLCPPW